MALSKFGRVARGGLMDRMRAKQVGNDIGGQFKDAFEGVSSAHRTNSSQSLVDSFGDQFRAGMQNAGDTAVRGGSFRDGEAGRALGGIGAEPDGDEGSASAAPERRRLGMRSRLRSGGAI